MTPSQRKSTRASGWLPRISSRKAKAKVEVWLEQLLGSLPMRAKTRNCMRI